MAKRGKHVAAECRYCNPALGGHRAPPGKVVPEGSGWAVIRWGQTEPILSGLVSKGEGFKVLWALKHRRGGVLVRMRGGEAPVWQTLEELTW